MQEETDLNPTTDTAPLKREIIERDVNLLKEHPMQQVVFPDSYGRDMADLVASIEKDGIHTPLEITPDDVIICGNRRWMAAMRLEMRKVPCWVRHDLKTENAIVRRLIEDNIDRRQLSVLGQVRCYKKLLDVGADSAKDRRRWEFGGFAKNIAPLLNMTQRNVFRYLAILNLPMAIQKAFERGQLTLKMTEQVNKLPKQVQEQIAQEIEAGKPPRKAVIDHMEQEENRQEVVTEACRRFLKSVEEMKEYQDDIDALDWLGQSQLQVLEKGEEVIQAMKEKVESNQAFAMASVPDNK